MDKQSRLERLIKIADILDKAGEMEDASFIDQMIKDTVKPQEEIEIEIPEEEYEILQKLYDSLGSSLKN
jgi:hypothetical protein